MNVCTRFSIQHIDHRLCLTASVKGKLKLFEHTWPSQSSMPPLTYWSSGTWNLLSAAKTALKLFLNSDIPIKPADHSYRSAVTLWSPALRMQPGVFNGPVTLITIILKTAVTARSSSNNFPCMLSGAERLKMCYRRIQVVWRRSEILSQLSGSSFKDFFDRLSSILFSSNGKWVGQSWFRSPRMI